MTHISPNSGDTLPAACLDVHTEALKVDAALVGLSRATITGNPSVIGNALHDLRDALDEVNRKVSLAIDAAGEIVLPIWMADLPAAEPFPSFQGA